MLSFGLLRAHLFLGSFPAFGYLWPFSGLFCLWAKFSPWLLSTHLWSVNTLGRFHVKENPLGCFHRVIKYGLLMDRYGPQIVWPMIGEMMIRPVEGPWILRDVEGPWIRWPVKGHGGASWPPFERYSIFEELSYSIIYNKEIKA